jgi:two-component system, NarL family, sensor histidine kinase UhpB
MTMVKLAVGAPSDRRRRAIARVAMEAKHAEEELQQSENRLRLVVGTIPTMAWSLLPDGAVDFVNQRWLEYTGLSLEEALADSIHTVHPEDLPRVMEKWRTDMAVGEQCEDDIRLRRADGEYRWFLVRTVPLRNEQGNIVKWYGTSTDITERKNAENALRDSGAQLQALTRRLVELLESERKDLARELRDRIGPTLTALSINLKLIKDALPPALRQALAHTLGDSRAQVHEATMAMRDVMGNLRPHSLDDHGLQTALAWYAKQFSARAGIDVSVRAGAPHERAAADVEIALFRIAQEALNNVAKHAHAKSVVIALECHGSEYVMSVVDDGMGFRASDERMDGPRPKLGVVTMRERARAVGGRLSVEPRPSGGTRLMVRVPK